MALSYTYIYSVLCATKKWAKCYHMFDHADTDTNMYVEGRYIKSLLCVFYKCKLLITASTTS